ncbi:hypothetical protein TNIN_71811 [Trichonephila inaurata madagascariensis]|uniref:Uncharacterized protein n=1 Tax=Trichonephila inaurata madagascariensis TaxID=2747483 RepID=A0A8X7C7N6_9ARAC|nr:hypothetical protein TNIN_71811 [Trichonephila inaurata madagascariensis]
MGVGGGEGMADRFCLTRKGSNRESGCLAVNTPHLSDGCSQDIYNGAAFLAFELFELNLSRAVVVFSRTWDTNHRIRIRSINERCLGLSDGLKMEINVWLELDRKISRCFE